MTRILTGSTRFVVVLCNVARAMVAYVVFWFGCRCVNVSLWHSVIPTVRLSNSSPLHGPGTRSVFLNAAALDMFGFSHDGLAEFLRTGNPV
jgi:hypothetical protein